MLPRAKHRIPPKLTKISCSGLLEAISQTAVHLRKELPHDRPHDRPTSWTRAVFASQSYWTCGHFRPYAGRERRTPVQPSSLGKKTHPSFALSRLQSTCKCSEKTFSSLSQTGEGFSEHLQCQQKARKEARNNFLGVRRVASCRVASSRVVSALVMLQERVVEKSF